MQQVSIKCNAATLKNMMRLFLCLTHVYLHYFIITFHYLFPGYIYQSMLMLRFLWTNCWSRVKSNPEEGSKYIQV